MSIGKSIWEDIKHEFRTGNVIFQLIAVNVVVFLIIHLVNVLLFLITPGGEASDVSPVDVVLDWLMIPANIIVLLKRPWTIITHMFTHFGPWHLLFNMLWMYWFGRIMQEFIGNGKILALYILGGLVGAALMIVSYNIFPAFDTQVGYMKALGASAGVMSIVVATATLLPDYEIRLLIFGTVKLKWIALVVLVLDFVSIAGFNSGGHIAHIGGAFFGYMFIKQLQAGNDWSVTFNKLWSKVQSFFRAIMNAFKPSKGPRVVYKQEQNASSRPTGKTTKSSKGHQEVVDAILDKINESGYDSLTKEEKEILFRAGGSN